MTEYYKAEFEIDALPGCTFQGFTNGSTWNGWACPLFEKNTAEEILHASHENGHTWRYQSESDTYEIASTNEQIYPPEQFKGIQELIGGREVTLYAIGAYSWTWVEKSSYNSRLSSKKQF